MTACHRQARQLPQAVTRCYFMFRVTDSEMPGNGYCADIGGLIAGETVNRRQIKHRLGAGIGFMAAIDKGNWVTAQHRAKVIALERGFIKADQDQPDTSAHALNHRVGGQRGGKTDPGDAMMILSGNTADGGVDRLAKPDGKIMAGCG